MAQIKAKVTLKKKGEEAYLAIQQLRVALKWTAAVDLDLMAFYKAKDGRVGGVFSDNYAGDSMGSLNAFPFIQLSEDAGVGATGGENEEVLLLTKLDELAEVYICALNFTDALQNRPQAFSSYDAYVEVRDDKGASIGVPLDSTQPGTVAVIAKIDNSGFMGAKLLNENRILDLPTFQATIPGANLLKLASKVVLKKKGEQAALPLKDLHVTLSWTAAVDLDLHAYYKPKKSGAGHVYFGNRGSQKSFPWIYLDQDAGVGDRGGANVENLYFVNLEQIDHILIAANIFNKPNANFASYDGLVTVQAAGRTVEVPLTESSPGSYCIIARVDNSKPSGPVLINVNQVQKNEPNIAAFLR